MEENRNADSRAQEKGEDDNGDRCDCTGDCSKGLRITENGQLQNREDIQQNNYRKEKARVQHLAFLHSCCRVLLLIKRKIKPAGRLFCHWLYRCWKKGTCLSLLPCIIYSLPPQLLAEMYYCTISPSFTLTFDDLYSINKFALGCSKKWTELPDETRDKTNTSKESTISCSLKLANIPLVPTLPCFCCMILSKINLFSPQNRMSHYKLGALVCLWALHGWVAL